jgi:hypothetical protein
MNGPTWVSRMSRDGRPVDHLSLQEPGLRIANRLLPGITNTTARARNYTIASWITTQARSPAEIRRLETAILHAASRHAHGNELPETGMVGINIGKLSKGMSIDLDRQANVTVLGAPFYGPSAFRLGAVEKRIAGGYGPTTDPVGRQLGRLGPVDENTVRYVSEGKITLQNLAAFETFCLCQPPGEVECNLLIELLFRFTQRSQLRSEEISDGPRRLSLGLLLLMVDAELTDRDAILGDLIAWSRGRTSIVTPGEAFAWPAQGFAILGLRSILKRSLENFWCSAMHDAGEFNDLVVDSPGFVDRVLSSGDSTALSLAACADIDTAIRQFSNGELLETNVKFPSGRDLAKSTVRYRMAAATYAALLNLVSVVEGMRDVTDERKIFINDGGSERVSLASFAGFTRGHHELRDWMIAVIDRYGVRQHLRAAATKWRRDGADGAFMVPEGSSVRVLESGLNIWPTGSPAKIEASLRLMRDLGLWVQDFNGARLTDQGRDVLERIKRGNGGAGRQ